MKKNVFNRLFNSMLFIYVVAATKKDAVSINYSMNIIEGKKQKKSIYNIIYLLGMANSIIASQ